MFKRFFFRWILPILCVPGFLARAAGLLVPAYFDPSSGSSPDLWPALTAAASRADIVAIINPNDGPDTAVRPEYTAAVGGFRDAGGRAIGYVYTGYGTRDMNLVKADIDAYMAFYSLDGIFLDEMSNESGPLAYYQTLYQYIKGRNAAYIVVGNPGTSTLETYLTAADVLVTFESDVTAYGSHVPSPWTANHPADRFAHLIYGTPSGSLQNVLNLAASRNAGAVYVTDDVLPNPWDTLPTYWDAEVTAVGTPVSLPAAPTDFAAVAGAPNSKMVTLGWKASTGATSYKVKRSTISLGPYSTVASGWTATTWTNTGLANNITYYYVVSAVNSAGESPNSVQASATPAGTPAAPTGVTATAGPAGSRRITIGWSASPGASTYSVKRSNTSGGPYVAVISGLAATSYTDTGLTAGKTYYYVVSAANAYGTSANSISVKAKAR